MATHFNILLPFFCFALFNNLQLDNLLYFDTSYAMLPNPPNSF